jgi:Na+-transporting methylmalonyl-CoA/oxaloacetate decarboxylase gamma subunit
MDDPAILTLVGVGIAVVVIAVYLIIIAMILKRVVGRLVIILDAVGQSTRRSEPVGAVLEDVNRDLEQGRAAIEACVQRLEQRFGTPDGEAEVPGIAMAARRPIVRTGYSAASAAADETITARANLRRGAVTETPDAGGDLGIMPPEHAAGPERQPTAPPDEPAEPGGPSAQPGQERGGGGARRWWNR